MKLLHIDSSVLSAQSVSRELTAAIVATLQAAQPGLEVVYRDLGLEAPAHLSGDLLSSRFVPVDQWTPAQQAEAALTETLLNEFLAADIVVIGAPMYNFSVPSQLKAWIDRIAVAGRTFKYTEQGPVGLAGGKKVFVASSRGGMYSTSAAGQAMDFQESYLQAVMGFLGVTEVEIVRAEGVSMGEGAKSEALNLAQARIRALAA